jgi:hypothetical protein
VPDRKSAETPYLDAVTARQRGNDLVENGVDDFLYVTLIEMWVLVEYTPDELRLDHQYRPRGRSCVTADKPARVMNRSRSAVSVRDYLPIPRLRNPHQHFRAARLKRPATKRDCLHFHAPVAGIISQHEDCESDKHDSANADQGPHTPASN